MDIAMIAVALVVLALSIGLPIQIVRTARSGTYDLLYILVPLAIGVYWLDYQGYVLLAGLAHGFRN
ncbi:hypothetical protein WT56_14075 [Burkholderia pseudomultivorans]|uniref:Uncharacterized protein n=2 Tax=Burkholderia pseudomultivorans TaxID=1207504 RepID=A0A132EJ05_9BURK|nr:hypothetical protein WT56_14075 [Burkholderia pseudomultivorans]